MKENQLASRLILALILLTGIVLRFWDYFNLPFTFDEMSAMSRTVYDNFSDLIKYGIVERDTHPAGVQVFMYFWVEWFGEAEWIVKLPFVLAGVSSIWLSYRIANLWIGKTSAMLTAAYVASLQLFVMYSQIARPYASGLFLTLVMVLFWSKYLIGKGKLSDLVMFVVFASLSSYNHHFSLLFAAIVGLSGFFFLRKQQLVPYILSGVAIFLLYIPHLQIFLAQLNKGGVGGWLRAPGFDFPLQFFDWLFHYSFWAWGVFFVAIIYGLFAGVKKTKLVHLAKKRAVLVLWFLLPMTIGFVYSMVREPIIQYSLLIFSTPYLFIFIFSFLKEMPVKKLGIIVLLILTVNVLSLVLKREYFKVFYRQGFEQVVKHAIQLEKEFPGGVKIINNYIPYYAEYYFRKYNTTIPYYTIRNQNLSTAKFDEIVKAIPQEVVITSAINDEYFQIVNNYFPYLIERDDGFTFEHYVFSKNKPDYNEIIFPDTVAHLVFDHPDTNWSFDRKLIEFDSLYGISAYYVDSSNKYGPSIEFPLSAITHYGYTFVDIAATIKPLDNSVNALLVLEIKKGREPVSWSGKNLYEFELKKGVPEKVFTTIYLHDALKTKTDIDGLTFKFHIWNPHKNDFLIEDLLITVRPGNPYRYALFYDFKTDNRQLILP